MTIQHGKDIAKAAALILQAWSDERKALTTLPNSLRPGNLAQAYSIQHAVSEGLGAIGGWIVWRSPFATAFACAPLPLASIHPSPALLSGGRSTVRRLVPGIGVRIGKNLPDYDAPFGHERIVGAIGSCHAAIGVRQPRIVGDADGNDLITLADGDGYAFLIYNRDGTAWRDAGLQLGRVHAAIAGKEIAARSVEAGRNVIAALHWLAHEGSRWAGGLMVSHFVMVAAETEGVEVPPDAAAEVSIEGLGRVEVRFSCDTRRPVPPSRLSRSLWPSWLKPSMRTSGH